MFALRRWLLLLCLCVSVSTAVGQDDAGKAFLLNVGKGQKPNDTGLDDKTVMSIVDSPELGAKAVKVPLAAEDSFGVSTTAVSNWTKYSRLRMNAFNPGTNAIELELVVVHSRSTGYQTRIAESVKLKPGNNEISIAVNELKNSNGSAPDLANVTKWYFADASKTATTFFMGDIWLESGAVAAHSASPAASPRAPAQAVPAQPSGPQPLIGYRVKGKVGTADVDLTFTPFVISAAGTTADGLPTATRQGNQARGSRTRPARMPALRRPVSFETPEADAIVSALEVFPPDNPLRLDVSNWRLHPNSQAIIASIGTEKPIRYNTDMGYILVPPNQRKVPVKLGEFAEESDKGPYPVPDNMPIELWPVTFQRDGVPQTLDQVQRNVKNDQGDRHAIVVDPVNRILYEFYQIKKTNSGWQANGAAIFDLKSNKLRPDGWTSADAAGLPIFPYTVRYDELNRGAIEHALRVTVTKSRRAYVYPATHQASKQTDENLPRMGERIRLRKDYDVSRHTPGVRTILTALQKYGMLVADNGIDWAISVTPDPRIPEMHDELRKLKGADFEVVEPPQGYEPPSR